MVHVLGEIHGALRPRGVLLDLHPLPRHPRVEVWRDEERWSLGVLDDSVGNEMVRRARGRLNEVVREGAFRVEGRRFVDWRVEYVSVDAWLRRRDVYGSTAVIPPGLLRRARRMMRGRGSTLVTRRRVRATALRRAPRRSRLR